MADILAIAAHPDDIELNVAGTLLKSQDDGRSIAICDLTAGERGSRGSAHVRLDETNRANAILGVDASTRWNLGIPDGDIALTKDNVLKVVRAIRHFRPAVLLFPGERDRHPDHEHANRLVRDAYFDAGLRHVHTAHDGLAQHPHRPERIYTFIQRYEREPDFIIDISDQFSRKLDAIAAYQSQFTVPGRERAEREGEPETFISSPEFLEYYIARMRQWGFLVGGRYGEGFNTVSGPVKVTGLIETV